MKKAVMNKRESAIRRSLIRKYGFYFQLLLKNDTYGNYFHILLILADFLTEHYDFDCDILYHAIYSHGITA